MTLSGFALIAVLTLGISLFGAIYYAARNDQSQPVDAIIVMGAAQYNGEASPVLSARLDEALQAYEEGLASVILVTGGGQEGDWTTEGDVSREYLMARGVPDDAILVENTGRNTWRSLQGAARLLLDRDLNRVLIVSDGFHLFRSKMMAQELGLEAYGRPADESPIRPNSQRELEFMIREWAGVVFHQIERRI